MPNRNLREIKCYGRIKWQSDCDYGKRNQAKLDGRGRGLQTIVNSEKKFCDAIVFGNSTNIKGEIIGSLLIVERKHKSSFKPTCS